MDLRFQSDNPLLPTIDWVFLVATAAELPQTIIHDHRFAVCRAKALAAGFKPLLTPSVLFVITGVGPHQAHNAFKILTRVYQPRFLINIGIAGCCGSTLRIGQWSGVSSFFYEDQCIPYQTPLPFFCPTLPLLSLRTVSSIQAVSDANLVDMEAFIYAKLSQSLPIAFSALKWGSDLNDENTTDAVGRCWPSYQAALTSFLSAHLQSRTPSIDVVIPVYNRQAPLARCLDSVRAQTIVPTSVIVVDDGSETDTSREIVANHPGYCYHRLPVNQGVSTARNVGVSLGSSEWIAFLDSDDEWIPTMLEYQRAFLEMSPFYAWFQSEETWIRHGQFVNKKAYHRKQADFIWSLSLARCLVSPSATMIRRDHFEAIGGFDEALPACEDYDLWLRLLRHLPVGLNTHPGLRRYGGHADQLSAAYPAMDRFRIHAMKKHRNQPMPTDDQTALLAMIDTKTRIIEDGQRKRRALRSPHNRTL